MATCRDVCLQRGIEDSGTGGEVRQSVVVERHRSHLLPEVCCNEAVHVLELLLVRVEEARGVTES